ncbi:condensation domain-containing protein [Streptomyces sp. MK7]|uniref:condensation domain-containing protein n=1 Tax=Streptomyces sp. MK7 TaxID=3067635 RepID=UPI00292FD1B6|nr:condensation domain-containing protein [Streptomyces sp. MK7]
MRMTDIQRCEVRPGLLVEWSLDPAAVRAATGLPDDSRPPAYIQESHIRTARSVREGGLFVPTWLGTAFDIPGRVDLDALQEALRGWMLRHETLRSGFRWAGDDMRRFTLDAADVSLRRETIGEFRDADVLVRYLQDRFDVVADALRWPNFLYTAVVREDGASVYMAFDHSNVDAYSVQRIPAEIHELYAAGARGIRPEREPAGSYVDFCRTERTSADEIDGTDAVVERWREFIDRCDGRLPNFPVDLGLKPGGRLPRQKLMREMLVDAEDAAAFEAYCRPFGGSLVGVLAATSLIVHEIGGRPVYRTVVPFHTRRNSRWLESVGWYVGGAPVEIHTARAPDFDSLLRTVSAQFRANRSLARMPLARVLRLLGSDFRPTSPDLYSIVSFVDARGIPGSERWTELKAYGLLRVSYGDQVCAWVTRLHEGLQFASRYPDTDVAHKNLRLYVERLREVIVSVARSQQPGGSSGRASSAQITLP